MNAALTDKTEWANHSPSAPYLTSSRPWSEPCNAPPCCINTYWGFLKLPSTRHLENLTYPEPVIALTDMERSRLLSETLALLKVLDECQCVTWTNQSNPPNALQGKRGCLMSFTWEEGRLRYVQQNGRISTCSCFCCVFWLRDPVWYCPYLHWHRLSNIIIFHTIIDDSPFCWQNQINLFFFILLLILAEVEGHLV